MNSLPLTVLLVMGAVIGLIMGIHYLRKAKKEEKKIDLKMVELECPECKYIFHAENCWFRDGLRGSFFRCSKCGHTSIWDVRRSPPKLKS